MVSETPPPNSWQRPSVPRKGTSPYIVREHNLVRMKPSGKRPKSHVKKKSSTKVTPAKAPLPSKPPYHSTNEQRNKTSCYKCGEDGLFKRDCNKYGFCPVAGHSAKNCRRRIREARGKYCEHCKIADLHNTYKCRKRDKQAVRNKVQLKTSEFHTILRTQNQKTNSQIHKQWLKEHDSQCL